MAIQKYALLTAMARKYGLVATASRAVCIGPLDEDLRKEQTAVCRVCAVDVKGARVAQAACIRQVEAGMEVTTHSDRIERSRAKRDFGVWILADQTWDDD